MAATAAAAAITAGGIAACGGPAPPTAACRHAVARVNADIDAANIDIGANLFPPKWLLNRASREGKIMVRICGPDTRVKIHHLGD